MNRKRMILVTGGAGFIGSSLVSELLKDLNNRVVVLDNLLTGKIDNLPLNLGDHLDFIKCDVNNFTEVQKVFNNYQFDLVFHYAAVVGVKRTLSYPLEVLNDVHGIENILNLSKDNGVKKVMYSSSSEVYGEPVEFPQNEETTPLNSRLPYAIVKNIGEAYFKSYSHAYGLNHVIYRFFNTYGPKQSSDFVISKFIDSALRNDYITVYGDGKQTRTFCYIENNIQATLKAALSAEYINQTINIGNESETCIIDLAKTIISLTGSSSKIVHLPPLPEGDMPRRQPDASKMKKILENQRMVSIEEGLERILAEKKSLMKISA
mgnify:CR=1 FL=1